MKLIEGNVGQDYKVSETSLPPEMERRLEALGLTYGSVISVMNKKKHGAMVIKIRGTRFAVGKNIAENVNIQEAESHE